MIQYILTASLKEKGANESRCCRESKKLKILGLIERTRGTGGPGDKEANSVRHLEKRGSLKRNRGMLTSFCETRNPGLMGKRAREPEREYTHAFGKKGGGREVRPKKITRFN